MPNEEKQMARVVTYTRVSSVGQQMEGASLGDQSERIERWLQSNGHTLVAAYSEQGSGGSAKNRLEFMRVMNDVEAITPDILCVDTSDRFTRNALDGGKWVSHLTDLGVRLAVIDDDEGRVLDMSVYSDRQYVTNAFMIADGERDRITKRIAKQYAERRRRGATCTNRPAFGLMLAGERKGHRRVIADPATAPVVQEVDRMILGGASQTAAIKFVRDVPGAWRSRRGLILALLNDQYIAAGVRDVETAQRLKALHASGVRRQLFRSQKAKTRDVRKHEWAGLIACGQCVDAGYSTDECRMYGRYVQSNPNPWNVVCAGKATVRRSTRMRASRSTSC
jgi:DNA invertase Pin-like site-specific DNA recombinase